MIEPHVWEGVEPCTHCGRGKSDEVHIEAAAPSVRGFINTGPRRGGFMPEGMERTPGEVAAPSDAELAPDPNDPADIDAELDVELGTAGIDLGAEAVAPSDAMLTCAGCGSYIAGEYWHKVCAETAAPSDAGLREAVDAVADALNAWDLGEAPRSDTHRHWALIVAALARQGTES